MGRGHLDRKTRNLLVRRLNRDAAFIAEHFGLRYRSIEAERANVKNRYGICYSDGTIKIRLRHVGTGQPLKYSSLVSTLCHELAHLRHFHHGPSFRSFYAELLRFARECGIYRPRPAASSREPAVRGRAPVAPPRVVRSRTLTAPTCRGPEQLCLF